MISILYCWTVDVRDWKPLGGDRSSIGTFEHCYAYVIYVLEKVKFNE